MRIVLASNNRDKLREICEILNGTGVEIISEREAGLSLDPEENGTTYEENARIKAIAAVKASGLPAVADDSGLEVAAMGGAPGIFSSRFCGVEQNYNEACLKIIDSVNRSETGDRSAAFVCGVVCVFPNGDEITSRGVLQGKIALNMSGTGGFGYDPIFIPDGADRTLASFTDDEKNAISHRGRAFRKFSVKLKKYMEKDIIKE